MGVIESMGNFTILRLLRVLRPMRTVKSVPSLRRVVNAVFGARDGPLNARLLAAFAAQCFRLIL